MAVLFLLLESSYLEGPSLYWDQALDTKPFMHLCWLLFCNHVGCGINQIPNKKKKSLKCFKKSASGITPTSPGVIESKL